MLLIFVIFFPLLAGIVLNALSDKTSNIKLPSLIVSVITLIASIALCFNPSLANISYEWLPMFNVKFTFGFDGLSALLVFLTTLLTPFIIASNGDNANKNLHTLILAMQTGLLGVYTALDGFLFYVFWELALIPIYFICAYWSSDKNRIAITIKFFIYTLLGSLLMLVALLYLGSNANSYAINDIYTYGKSLSNTNQSWVFWCLFLAFAIKMPIFPLHTWQPDLYTTSPTQGTMLLSGIMLKMGIYGCMRWLIPVVPQAVAEYQTLVIILAIAGIVYSSVIALVQQDVKRMYAYSSIAHIGLIGAGIFIQTTESFMGVCYQLVAHGINAVAMFYIIHIIEQKTKTRNMQQLGGIAHNNPKFATLFLIVVLGNIALPLTNGFIGEFLLLLSVYQFSGFALFFAGLTVILGAIYMLNAYRNIMFGEVNEHTKSFTDLSNSQLLVIAPLCLLIIIMGLSTGFISQLVEPVINQLLSSTAN